MSKKLEFFDCDALIGTPRAPIPRVAPSVADLRSEMRRLGIARALVRHRACAEAGAETGNRLVLEEAAGQKGLLPVWDLTPDTFFEMGPPATVVAHMLSQGVAAAWMKPAAHDFVLEPWCCGRMLAALSDRRVPLLVEWDDATRPQVDEVMGAFPDLRLVLLRVPRQGRNRSLYPLLERHGNLYAAVAPLYSVYRGIEDLCKDFGATRFLFGAGYPDMEGGAAISMITYADISDKERAAIASGNLKRLLAEVRS